jgi:ankyrin repeat protein
MGARNNLGYNALMIACQEGHVTVRSTAERRR